MPNVGDLGPAFALSNQEDQMIILDRLTSRYSSVVVAFLPQAGAPGCTREASGFRDLQAEFAARGVAVVCITPSRTPEVAQFARENKLNFDVLSDPTRRICEEWGAVRGDATARITYIVSEKGIITHYFPRVDVFKHAAEVLALFAGSPLAAPAPAPTAAQPAATAAPAAAVPPAASSASGSVPAAGTGELIVQAARASLGLLLAHQQAGGSIPADVLTLCARLGQTSTRN
jgi:peroxiredoxin Q/BCP